MQDDIDGDQTEIDPIDAPAEDDEQTEGETPAVEQAGEDDESGDLVVTIGDEPAPVEQEEQAKAPEWVRDLRKSNRELVRKQRELEAENSRLKGGGVAAVSAPVLGAKPTLEGCGYDAEDFSAKLEAWHDTRRKVEEATARQERDREQGQRAWQAKLDAYAKSKAALKVRDFDDAEGLAQDVLSPTQQGVIVNASKNPAALVYALGKNPKKAKELAAIADPVQFTWAVAQLETQLKMTPRKTAPLPERVIRGSAVNTGGTDTTLERLRAEADRTGDRSKVAAHIRSKAAAQRA